jgi:hypothetical protein
VPPIPGGQEVGGSNPPGPTGKGPNDRPFLRSNDSNERCLLCEKLPKSGPEDLAMSR